MNGDRAATSSRRSTPSIIAIDDFDPNDFLDPLEPKESPMHPTIANPETAS